MTCNVFGGTLKLAQSLVSTSVVARTELSVHIHAASLSGLRRESYVQ